MPVTDNARVVLEKRYLKKDEEGRVLETPEDMVARVSYNIALAEALSYGRKMEDVLFWAERFYEMINSLEFMPNSPTLMNAGKELQQLSACFVLPVDDSMESIFDAVKFTALIHKSGGGTGFSFSRLRPKNDVVRSTKGVSSGPISFMTVFDSATETIKQGGTRRGANMGILRVDHPDILDFITCKRDTKKLNNFNISVALTEEFMKAVEEGTDYPLVNPRTKEVVEYLPAREVFDKIVESAWENGEPGIIFLDRINRDNPTPALGEIESTNPCGEQPLLPFESCNLGSVNLSRMLTRRGEKWEIDYEKLRERVHRAVRFLDNVIDMNNYPLPQIEEITKKNRKIGLGIMGFADMLYRLGIPYDSEEALQLAEEVMAFVQEESKAASRALARERGSFPNFGISIYAARGEEPLRNATTTTIAPTGTISIIAGCSSGIEPVFALVYERHVLDNQTLYEVNPIFLEYLREHGLDSEELIARVSKAGGRIRDHEEFDDEAKRVFVTAYDVTPYWHVRMQAAFQKFTDNAVSKTVNFPREATREDIREAYLLAYRLGCKGVTVYRDGSREGQVLTAGTGKEKAEGGVKEESAQPVKVRPRPRPDTLVGITKEMRTGCGKLYVTMNRDERGLFEIFNQMGKAGGCASSQSEAIGRLVSLALRSGVDGRAIVKQLKGISCQMNSFSNGGRILSCADAVAKAIEWYLDTYEDVLKELPPAKEGGNGGERSLSPVDEEMDLSEFTRRRGACPECGSQTELQEGCEKCRSCGFSEC
ncbi:MAG: vitamin B12-dependent ribonucleotide reductase [Deltaproteobacteria bacterium]|nr:MAG: vitamin B12-dependent ribonucleotide reductase [Deltaproteobacteria bacterium]